MDLEHVYLASPQILLSFSNAAAALSWFASENLLNLQIRLKQFADHKDKGKKCR